MGTFLSSYKGTFSKSRDRDIEWWAGLDGGGHFRHSPHQDIANPGRIHPDFGRLEDAINNAEDER
jgi:hypothetical protein